MKYITLENTSKKDFHQFMLGSIVPRPIALVSTVDEKGIRNLAPFSYFNAVSSVPPILMISVGRKPDGSKKDTLLNVEKTKEFVVNMVPYPMIRQMALTSVMIPSESDEFELSGLHGLESYHIQPFRIKESPIQFECTLNRIVELGTGPAESSLIFGDVKCIHVDESIIDENNRIDPANLDIVGRLGRSYYTRINASSIETVIMSQMKIPIGFNNLPHKIITSRILSANELSVLAAAYKLPDQQDIKNSLEMLEEQYANISEDELMLRIREFIQNGDIDHALNLAFSLS